MPTASPRVAPAARSMVVPGRVSIPLIAARSFLSFAFAGVAAALTTAFSLFTVTGQRADEAAMTGVSLSASSLVNAAGKIGIDLIVPASVVTVLFSVVFALWKRRYLAAGAAIVVVAGSNLTAQLLKDSITRPSLLPEMSWYGNSLPSGHATLVLSATAAAGIGLSQLRAKWIVLALIGITAVAGSIGVVAAGWHRPSDVLVAGFIVVAWLYAVTGVTAMVSIARARRDGVAVHRIVPAARTIAGVVGLLLLMAAGTNIALYSLGATGPFVTVVAVSGIAALIAVASGASVVDPRPVRRR